MDSDDSQSNKRRKTDVNDGNDVEEENPNSEDLEITDDTDSYLQEFLSKRPQNDLSLFQRVIKDEELEARGRDPEGDLKLYRDACADFSDCVSDIAELKATKPDGWKDGINELRKEAAFITLTMKKLNRVEKTRTKLTRERIIKEKQKVDIARIKLDNMLSEILHLKREVDKCLKFRSRPLGIDLVSVNEFYEKAPAGISRPEITRSDEHQLQLARLEWELKQRKELSALLSDLENKRSSIGEQIAKRERDLNSIGPLVNDVLTVSQPLKEKLGSIFNTRTNIADQAYLLPDPLYFLYVQASAYRDVSDKDISLDIKGNFAEAQKFKNWNIDGFFENDRVDIKEGKRNLEHEKIKLFIKHPLSIHLKFSLKDGFLFDLQFIFFLNLNLATVKPSISAPSGLKNSSLSEFFLNPKNLLHNLFPGDSGTESPNLMNYYQIQKVGLNTLPLEKMGLPYIWAQKIVGLNFLAQAEKISPKQDVCRSSLPVVVKELKRRFLYRLSLMTLVGDLEQGNFVLPLGMKQLKVTAQLNYIKGISWTEYCESPLSKRFRDTPCVDHNDIFLKAQISKGEAKLLCLIAVKPDYPLTFPVFSMKLDYGPLKAGNQEEKYSLDIEEEVNTFWKELLTSKNQAIFLLSFQLFKTLICFEIVLESLFPDKFPTNKRFESILRGRQRYLPFKFFPEENLFVHRK